MSATGKGVAHNPPTQLRPPHPALVCLLASARHLLLTTLSHTLAVARLPLSPHLSSPLLSLPSPIPLSRCDQESGQAFVRIVAWLLKRGCACGLRQVGAFEPPQRAPGSVATQTGPEWSLQ